MEIQWNDVRISKPRCHTYDHYLIIQKGDSRTNVCAWVPTNNYTDGYWAILGRGVMKSTGAGVILIGDK